MKNKGPSFLGIGANKAGTSWLYQQLKKHPEIWMPPIKELHFFDRSPRYPSPNTLDKSSPITRIFGSNPWERSRVRSNLRTITQLLSTRKFQEAAWWCKWTFGYYSEQWYQSLFSQGRSYLACGEITPAYSILESNDVVRINTLIPDVKLIFMVRNPIDQVWSSVRFDVNRGKLDLSLDSEEQIISYLKTRKRTPRGNYEQTLENYLKHFDSQQILVGFYDAIEHDASALLSGITALLNISPFEECDIDTKTRFNASPPLEMPSKVRGYLLKTNAPLMKRLADRLGSYAKTWGNVENSGQPSTQQSLTSHPLPPVLHP